MTKDEALGSVRMMARAYAGQVQEKAGTMSGTELYAEKTYIPDFAAAMEQKNMLERAAGFVCRAPSGRVVVLLQPYDSSVYTGEPETLPAQWGFKWSTEPGDALPFVAISTSPLRRRRLLHRGRQNIPKQDSEQRIRSVGVSGGLGRGMKKPPRYGAAGMSFT